VSAVAPPIQQDVRVISLISVAHAISHFFQVLVPPLFPLIKDDLGVSYTALGAVIGLYYLVSGIFQTVAGFAVDRFGARRVLTLGLACCVLGAAMAGLARSYEMLVVAALIGGLGNSVFHPSDFAILNGRVSQSRLPYAYSSHGIGGSLGYALAPLFSAATVGVFGWHGTVLGGAGIGAAVLVAVILNREALEVVPTRGAMQKKGYAEDFKLLTSTPVLMCFGYFLLVAIVFIAVLSFGVSALVAAYDISPVQASAALTTYMFGAAGGILVGGIVAARGWRPERVASGGMAASAAVMFVIALVWLPALALPLLFAMSGFANGMTNPSRDLLVRQTTPPASTGAVYGFVYSGLDLGSVLAPLYFGWLLDHGHPQAVFFTASGVLLVTILTVLKLPARSRPVTA
jgi:MFS family permease